MQIQENISLKKLNSFQCEAKASYFVIVQTKEALIEAIEWANAKGITFLIIGGGSNILFTQDVSGLVIKMEIKGIHKSNETSSAVFLTVGAGENWHHFVQYTIQKSWGGLENLSLIPGTVGAAPIQNIGAYGVEIKDCIDTVYAYEVISKKLIELDNAACQFDYRNSIFKKEKNKYIIYAVQFKLQKQPHLNISYGAIREQLYKQHITNPNLENVSQAVVAIRREKLPDPSLLGNAGSFFKNPMITKAQYVELLTNYPNIVAYPISDDSYKIAAGWLIEAAGWKGKKIGPIGSYDKQALVIVNYGNGTGKEVYNYSESIIQSVQEKFGVQLEREVNVY